MRFLSLLGIASCAFAASDPNYRALRDGAPSDVLLTENIELKRDVGTITLKNGQLAFLPPVLNHRAIAVFTGEGVFRMKAAIPVEERHLALITGKPEVEEAFDSAVFFFSDGTYDEVKSQSSPKPLDPRAPGILKDLRDKLRKDRTYGDIGNVEAELLGELYNPKRAGSFRAYFHGKRNSDLRFFMAPAGALPAVQSPEETALVNVDVTGDKAGIWYLSHFKSEWEKNTANSNEDKRDIGATHYKIDTEVAKGGALSATTEMEFTAVSDGARVLRVDLLPTLRMKRVTDGKGREILFLQESTKAEDSFHVVLPEPLEQGKKYSLRFEYEGTKVIHDVGGGNFAVVARTSWYPNVNSFNDHATYELKFHAPKVYTLVSVGKKISESKDGANTVSEWKSDVPIAVAGFNYGEFKKKGVSDEVGKYELEVYTTDNVPDFLRGAAQTMSLSPSAMARNALVDAENSMRLFQKVFGDCPFGRLAVTQQPAFNFGQSWPTLVYLPVSAFLDSTQRWELMGGSAFKFAEFIDEVTPHEVAHQWWGHMVGWASYHDQWLSEGLAEFSAGLFLEATQKPGEVDKFWDRLRLQIIEKNNFGISANDAGPIWLGYRLNTQKTPGAARHIIYPKGAYLAQMIRMLMRDEKTGDQDFNAMMQDFVKTYLYRNASSEQFMAVVSKHMKPAMDLDGSHNMGWFLREWIYGTDLPKYRLEYSLKPAENGKIRFSGKFTQSDVPADFVMRVPLYMDFDGRVVRIGTSVLRGSMTGPEIQVNLPKKPRRVLLTANHDVLTAEAVVKETP
jgi:Peptidase family M1 domain